MNDLITRSHVSDMFNDADDRQEYQEYLESLGTPIDDDCGDWIAAVSSPDVERIEDDINATIERQCNIAQLQGMTLDQYREDLADRRDILMDAILHARAMNRIANAK